MHNTQDASLFSVPTFSDSFRSYFDEQNDLDIGSNVVSFSPLTRHVSKFIKTVKVKGRDTRALNLEEFQKHVWRSARPDERDDVRHRVYYPSRDVPETSWCNVRLLQVDFCNRDDGMTALLWAAHIGDREGLKRLLSSGADANRQLKNGNTVLMETIAGNPCTRHACVDILLDHGVGINLQNQVGHTAFTAASSVGDAKIVKSMFVRYRTKININHKTSHGSSALMLAIAGHHKDIVEFLFTQEPDLLQEDKDHMTALCWAQVLNPSLAGLLSLQLGLKNALADYVRRRVELLQARNDKLEEFFGLFYQISFLLLNFDVARRVLIKEGVLRTLTFHPIWDKMKLVVRGFHEKGFYQVMLWFIALGCAMVKEEHYSIQNFTSNGAGQLYLEDVNETLGNALDDEDIYMAHSLMIPLMAHKSGRHFIIDKGFKYRHILDLFTDTDDVLTEKSQEIFKCCLENMKAPLEQYKLKHWKKVLGVEVQKPSKMPVMERLKRVYKNFVLLREEARQIKSKQEKEDLEVRQAREAEMLKQEKNRAKRSQRRERRRMSYNEQGQNAMVVDRAMHQALRSPDPKPEHIRDRTKTFVELVTEQIPKKNGQRSPLRGPRLMHSPNNKYGTSNQQNLNTVPTHNGPVSGSEPVINIAKETEARGVPAKPTTIPMFSTLVKPASTPVVQISKKPAAQSPIKRTPQKSTRQNGTTQKVTPTVTPQKGTPLKATPKPNTSYASKTKLPRKLLIEDFDSDVKKQIDSDYLLAVDIQEKLDIGLDMVDEKAPEEEIAEEEKKKKKRKETLNENRVPTTFPSIPKEAVLVENLEKGFNKQIETSLREVKSDGGINYGAAACAEDPNSTPKLAEINVDDKKSAGDAINHIKYFNVKNWQKRSKRWNGLLEQLINLPADMREKCGSMHFSFADPSLYLAKGSEGTVVSVGIRDDGTEVAVKRMLKSHFKFICNELQNLRLPELEIGNFVQYKDYAEDNYFGYLALELCEYTLDEYIVKLKEEKQLLAHSKRLVKELFTGLKALHDAKILHRDLKPRNVLIDIRGTLKLADFGVSKKMSEDESTIYQTSAMGTRCWRPTETLRSLQRGLIVPFRPASDIQVAGMIAYFIISGGVHPYGQDPAECEINIRDCKPVALANEKDDILLGLLAGSLHFEPTRRRTAEQILLHPYFWSIETKFEFLQKVKRTSEIRMKFQCQMTKLLNTAENWIGCKNWISKQDSFHMSQMQYQGFVYTNTVVDFLSFIIDTDEMFSDLPVHLQTVIGDPRKHFITEYPRLFMAVYEIVRDTDWKDRRLLVDFFKPQKQE